jgi:ribosome-binding factor A
MARIERINEMMKREIGSMILRGELNDARVAMVTITHVDVSRDLQHARVNFTVMMGQAADITNAQKGLNSARGYVRKLIGQRIRLRYTPEIQFVYDKSLEYSAQIDKTLQEIHEAKAQQPEEN